MADSPLEFAAPSRGRAASKPRARRLPSHLALAIAGLLSAAGAQAQRSCEDWSATFVAVEGRVEVQRASSGEWHAVATGDRACTGDSVRSDATSRAALMLPDESTIRLDEHGALVLSQSASGTLIDLLQGLIHIISRDPRRLSFRTPFANAGLEGTEFDIRVNEAERQTEIAVLEGQVSVTTPDAELMVDSGQIAIARQGAAPTAVPLAAPIELMRWASYYAPIVAADLPRPDQAPAPSEERDADFFAHRAAALLETARVESAQSDLATALRLDPANATALALRGTLALAHGDRASAEADVAAATAADDRSVVALIAMSQVQLAAGELADADATLRRALALEPDNWIALTRAAEVSFARGDALAAIEQATRASALAPSSAAPLVVSGFVQLSGRESAAAQATFERAVALEPEAPLPRLGLALTAAQRGDIVEGRRQLELAVTNDPASSLGRSYMAKLYAAEYRSELTITQLNLAKDFDPLDSTPWLYSALQQLHVNHVIGALRDARAAAERNGDRAVFRARLLLDEDLATRSAALGRVHTEAGFGRLGLVDAWQAVVDSPDDHAGHRLLTDLYAFEARHEVGRVSELLMSQLLQPINVTTVKPQLGQPTSFLAQRAGPSVTAFDEFTSPVATNGLKLSASSVVGGNGTRGTDVAAAGLADRLAYGAGYYRFETDGFRENNDFEQRIANAFVQFQPRHTSNLQAELRSVQADYGDPVITFDRSQYSPTQHTKEHSDSLRLGAKQQISTSATLLASVIYQDAQVAFVGGGVGLDVERNGYSIDIQHQRGFSQARLQNGVAYASQDDTLQRSVTFPGDANPTVFTDAADQRQIGLYSYAHFSLRPTLTLTVGASLDRVQDPIADEDGLNPKLALMWRPTTQTTVRAAAFRTLFGSLTTSPQNPQPRLEPAQLAGFTQLLSVGTADVADVRGLAVDHELTENVFAGWEATLRMTDRPFLNFLLPGTPVERVDLEEREQRGYLYWIPSDRLSFSARLEKGRYSSEPAPMFGYSHMQIDRLPLELRYFLPTGLSLGLRATRVEQRGMFELPAISPFDPPAFAPGEDRFVTVDAFVSYRLPKRRGILSLNADNLLDERFSFQDIDPTNPSLFPERLVSFRFTLAFD